MNEKENELKKEIRRLIRLDYIMPEDIPDIELYMDQVIRFMDAHLQKNVRADSADTKTLTKTMINNYTKNKLLPPPEKKRYTKEHIIMLISIYYLKNIVSINDIRKLLEPMQERYFERTDESGRSLSEIYSQIFNLEKRQYFNIENSILRADEIAELKVNGTDDEYIKKLTFIYMLAYDIYSKKCFMEHLIDEIDEAEKRRKEKDSTAAGKAGKSKKTSVKKTAAKTPARSATKSAAKTSARSVTKSAAKTPARSTAKSAAKTSARSATKSAAKTTAKSAKTAADTAMKSTAKINAAQNSDK
ncbi:protein of unknown function [Eubacterium ruminantium]|nr:protein of unknown function [Eubacterium ruminantium]